MEYKYKVVFISLLCIISLSLVGCSGDSDSDTNISDDLVWNTFSNDYVEFKYPSKWNQTTNDVLDSNDDGIKDEFIVQFENQEANSGVEVDLTLTKEGSSYPPFSSKQGFYDYIEGEMENSPDDVNIEVNKRITFNGYPAYKAIYTFTNDDEIKVKEHIILVYKNTFIQEIFYIAKDGNYTQALADEIINSLQFNR